MVVDSIAVKVSRWMEKNPKPVKGPTPCILAATVLNLNRIITYNHWFWPFNEIKEFWLDENMFALCANASSGLTLWICSPLGCTCQNWIDCTLAQCFYFVTLDTILKQEINI